VRPIPNPFTLLAFLFLTALCVACSDSAALFDYDNDGDLDVFLTDYGPNSFRDLYDVLLRNETESAAGHRSSQPRHLGHVGSRGARVDFLLRDAMHMAPFGFAPIYVRHAAAQRLAELSVEPVP
jgi:hypothetical protein